MHHSAPCDRYRIKVFKGASSFYPFRQSYQAPGVGDCLRQQLGSRLAWTLTAGQPSLQSTTSKGFPNAVSRGVPRSRREGDTSGEQRYLLKKMFLMVVIYILRYLLNYFGIMAC